MDDGSCEIESCGGCSSGSKQLRSLALIDNGSCEVIVVDDLCDGDLNGDGAVLPEICCSFSPRLGPSVFDARFGWQS